MPAVGGRRTVVWAAAAVVCAVLFFACKLEQIFEMTRIPILQQLVRQHLAQRRRNVDRDTWNRSGFVEVLKDEDQRKVDLGDGFEKPIFFEELRIFGMTDKWQVSVKN